MALTLVYTGEHYVVDVVAGWLVAALAVAVAVLATRLTARWHGRRHEPRRRVL